jgi:hypothetical protein
MKVTRICDVKGKRTKEAAKCPYPTLEICLRGKLFQTSHQSKSEALPKNFPFRDIGGIVVVDVLKALCSGSSTYIVALLHYNCTFSVDLCLPLLILSGIDLRVIPWDCEGDHAVLNQKMLPSLMQQKTT